MNPGIVKHTCIPSDGNNFSHIARELLHPYLKKMRSSDATSYILSTTMTLTNIEITNLTVTWINIPIPDMVVAITAIINILLTSIILYLHTPFKRQNIQFLHFWHGVIRRDSENNRKLAAGSPLRLSPSLECAIRRPPRVAYGTEDTTD